MHVVAVTPLYPPNSRVGAFLATHELLAELAARGDQVDVYRRLGASTQYALDGVAVHGGRSEAVLDRAIRAADVVVSHCGDDGMAPFLAKRHGRPSVRMVHGYHKDVRDRLDGAALAVFNSRSLADEAAWDGPQIIVNPPLRPGVEAAPGDRVTLVNLSQEKGGELFWRLTKKLSSVKFLAVRGGWGLQLIYRRPNVKVLRRTSRMASVYGQTRVLLMPSQRETWGLVGVEAMSCGIPVVAHPTPGLRESLGDAGIFADRDHEREWLDAILQLQDPTEWEAASRRALARVFNMNGFTAGKAEFAGALESLVPAVAA